MQVFYNWLINRQNIFFFKKRILFFCIKSCSCFAYHSYFLCSGAHPLIFDIDLIMSQRVCVNACSLKRKTKKLDNVYSGVCFYVHEYNSTMAIFIGHLFISDTRLGDLCTPFPFTLTSLQSRYYYLPLQTRSWKLKDSLTCWR